MEETGLRNTTENRIDAKHPLQQVRISVRSLVEFLLRSGDIDNRNTRGMQLNAMQEGTRIHKKLQRMMGSDYYAEVPLRFPVETERYVLSIEGRADGIFVRKADEGDFAINGCIEGRADGSFAREDISCIDEIKGVYQDVTLMEAPVPVHLAQAKCYV